MIAHVADSSLVLEQYDSCGKNSMKSACKTTKITQEVEQTVHFASNDPQISVQLVCYNELNIVREVVKSERSRRNLKHRELLTLSANRRNLITQIKLC